MAKSNDMAIAYLRGLAGEVRKGAMKKYRKGNQMQANEDETVRGGFGEDEAGEDSGELEALLASLGDDALEPEDPLLKKSK